MNKQEQDRISELVLKINTEKNYNRFMALVEELNSILEGKEKRLAADSSNADPT